MTSVSRFLLNKHGRVFHLTGCDSAGKAQPWAWVEPLTNSQIHQWIEPLGIRPCRRCDPLENKIVADEFLKSSLIQEGGALGRIRREAKITMRTRARDEAQEAMVVEMLASRTGADGRAGGAAHALC